MTPNTLEQFIEHEARLFRHVFEGSGIAPAALDSAVTFLKSRLRECAEKTVEAVYVANHEFVANARAWLGTEEKMTVIKDENGNHVGYEEI